jgi:hypothetical protein
MLTILRNPFTVLAAMERDVELAPSSTSQSSHECEVFGCRTGPRQAGKPHRPARGTVGYQKQM